MKCVIKAHNHYFFEQLQNVKILADCLSNLFRNDSYEVILSALQKFHGFLHLFATFQWAGVLYRGS